jgi:hypothetical protein
MPDHTPITGVVLRCSARELSTASSRMTRTGGDTVEFSGQYEWNSQGGVVHWTHHDPAGEHRAGWLKHRGVTYQ